MDRRGFIGGTLAGGFAGLAGLFGMPRAKAATVAESEEFRSPLIDAVQWQIPTRRRETWLWAEYFYANDPEVARLLDMQQALYLAAMDREVGEREKAFVRDLCLFGNSFWTDDQIAWKAAPQRLSPYYIDFNEDGSTSLLPDDDLKRSVWLRQPYGYGLVPGHVRAMILAGRPVPINVHRFAVRNGPVTSAWPVGEGRPRWYSCFRYLVCKQKMMEQAFVQSPDAAAYLKEIKKGNPIAVETSLTEKAYLLLGMRGEFQGTSSYRQIGRKQREAFDSAIYRDIEDVDREACRFGQIWGKA